MSWTWHMQRANGARVDEAGQAKPPVFPSQSDAETWIGEEWPALVEAGFTAVTLFEDDREVYGPMSLLAE